MQAEMLITATLLGSASRHIVTFSSTHKSRLILMIGIRRLMANYLKVIF